MGVVPCGAATLGVWLWVWLTLSPLQVSYMVSAIQAGAIGTQACNEAVSAIGSIVGDLETTAMFCTAGALTGKIL